MAERYLVGEKVTLRGVRREDLIHFQKWWDNSEATYYMESGWCPATEPVLESFVESANEPLKNIVFLIEEKPNSKPIGTCGLYEIFWPGRRTEYRILIGDPSMFDKGYGTEASRLTVSYGFERLNMEVIHLGVNASNVRAVKAYEKVGFVHEGVRRKYVFSRGSYHDAVMMSILREEFMASKKR